MIIDDVYYMFDYDGKMLDPNDYDDGSVEDDYTIETGIDIALGIFGAVKAGVKYFGKKSVKYIGKKVLKEADKEAIEHGGEDAAKEISKGGLNSVDDIVTQGQKALDNFDIDSAYVKPKHLSTSGGNGAKFIGDSKGSAETILRDALKNGKVNSIIDNGLTQQGKQSYRIVIDAGKEIGTKGETLIRIVISEDGGMLSAFPVK